MFTRRLQILLAGSILFATQAVLQQTMAVPYGTGRGLVAVVLGLNLLGGSLGALVRRLPAGLAPALLAVLMLSPLPKLAMASPSPALVAALTLAVSALTGSWIATLLSSAGFIRSRLVAWEWLGGILGCGAVLLVLLPHFPLTSICRWLGIASVLGCLLSLQRRSTPHPTPTTEPVKPLPSWLWLSAWSGFQFFFAEVTWTHLLSQAHANSHLAFGLMVLAFLIAMPLAALAAGHIRSVATIAILAIFGGLCLPVLFFSMGSHIAVNYAQANIPWLVLAYAIVLIAPSAASASMLFPYLLDSAKSPSSVRTLYAVNLAGGLAGALAAGFLSLPSLPLPMTLCVPALGWCVVLAWGSPTRRRLGVLVLGLILMACAFALWSWEPGQAPKDYRTLERAEGWDGRMELVERQGHLFLLYNGRYSLGGSRSLATEQRQAQLALDLRPNAHKAFVLGLGTGITAGQLLHSESLQTIRVVEISSNVIDLAKRSFTPWTNGLFSSPRVRIESGDARISLMRDTTKYDIILGDLFLPWLPGAELLMSREHFASVRRHLSSDGLFVQWLPLYQLSEPMFADVLATTLAEFPDVYLFRGDLDTKEPMIALVATSPGNKLHVVGGSPEVLALYAGNAHNLSAMLQDARAWDQDNRIARILQSGGMYSGMPAHEQRMSGERYLNWIARAFQAKPPESEPAVQGFGPEAWRYAAQGFFLQQALFYQQRGDVAAANTMAERAVKYGPK